MSTPKSTREQIGQARGIACNPQAFEREELVGALRVLLAATDPPTDEQLADEAARVAPVVTKAACTVTAAYAAGARREGR